MQLEEKGFEQIMSCWPQPRILMHSGLQKHYIVLKVMDYLHYVRIILKSLSKSHGLVGSFGPLLTFYNVGGVNP